MTSSAGSGPNHRANSMIVDGMENRVAELEHRKIPTGDKESPFAAAYDDDPVCIVGMACRLPGDVKSPSALWDFIYQKKSAQGPVPVSRFSTEGYYVPNGSRAGVMNTNGGYFLEEDVRQFDNGFFGINNLEATYMDPQQRKLLEVVFECFEDAGLSMNEISGSNTGVYVGNFSHDYFLMQTYDPDEIHRYHGVGSGQTLLANRISHVFNLHGPSFVLDTACSASIYSLHVAAAALRVGDCSSAVVAGVNLILSPQFQVLTSKTGVLSASSTCRTFDASADGYGRAEGVNAVLLKRLSSAVRDGDNIQAVIRGSAVNSNGRTPGVSVPSATQQEAVIRKAYSQFGLNLLDTDYVECHGTGTAVGDPIEVEALGRCFVSEKRNSPLLIGGIKPNFGHSEAASGLTSVIKVVMSFKHDVIPPTIDVEQLNPKLRLKEMKMKVAFNAEKWPNALRRASLNSFGYGGANAHVILESIDSYFGILKTAPRSSEQALSAPLTTEQILVLPVSAASELSLRTRMEQVTKAIKASSTETLDGLAYTLCQRVSHMTFRSHCLVSRRGDRGTSKLLETGFTASGDIHVAKPLPIVLLFTGQGAQFATMGKTLLEHEPTFRGTIRDLDRILSTLPPEHAPNWTLEESILEPADTSRINDVTRSQPLCTAIQIGIVNILRSWGCKQSAVIGHSSGEIGAAYASGLHDASEAILAAYLRGFVVGHLALNGAMIAAGIGPGVARLLLKEVGLSNHLEVACINSPESVTISGPADHIVTLMNFLRERKIFCRQLQTGGRAYHSSMMKGSGELYENLLRRYIPKKPCSMISTMYSSVGEIEDHGLNKQEVRMLNNTEDMCAYWRRNLEKSVQFSSAVLTCIRQSRNLHFIEIGPHSALKGPLNQIIKSLESGPLPVYLPSLIRNEDSLKCIKCLAGELFSYGHDLSWPAVNALSSYASMSRDAYGPYPWDYSSGMRWSESQASLEMKHRQYPRHELLGTQRLSENGLDWRWFNTLRLNETLWLRDHKIDGRAIFPAAGYMAMAIEAVSQVQNLACLEHAHQPSFDFHQISFEAALVLPDPDENEPGNVTLHTTMRKSASNNFYDFTISTWKNGRGNLHCSGSVQVKMSDAPIEASVPVQYSFCERAWSMSQWYDRANECGFNFGPSFRSIRDLYTDTERSHCRIVCTSAIDPISSDGNDTYYPMHPILMDACLQTVTWSAAKGSMTRLRTFIPLSVSRCRITPLRRGCNENYDTAASLHTISQLSGVSIVKASCTARVGDNEVLMDWQDIHYMTYNSNQIMEPDFKRGDSERHPALRAFWKPDILRLSQGASLDDYIDSFNQTSLAGLVEDERVEAIFRLLIDIAGHHNPKMDVLHLTDLSEQNDDKWRAILDDGTYFPRYGSWHHGTLENDCVKLPDNGLLSFHMVFYTGGNAESIWKRIATDLRPLIGNPGIILIRKSSSALSGLSAAGFNVTVVSDQVLLAVRTTQTPSLRNRNIKLITRDPSPRVQDLTLTLIDYLKAHTQAADVAEVCFYQISETEILKSTIWISLIEIETELLASITSNDMDTLHKLTNNATDLIWLTSADMLGRPKPTMTLVNGLSRALMLEQPALRFAVLDVGSLDDVASGAESFCGQVISVLLGNNVKDDNEFTRWKGILHVSRLGPDVTMNNLFQRRLQFRRPTQASTLNAGGLCALRVDPNGDPDSLYFQQLCEPPVPLLSGFLEIRVTSVCFNSQDTINPKVIASQPLPTDIAGIVTAIGPYTDTDICIGDSVIGSVPRSFSTIERISVTSVQKVYEDEDLSSMVSLMFPYAAALYILRDIANIQVGETILFHSDGGDLGMAAVAVAQHMGANIIVSAESKKRRLLLSEKLLVPMTHILDSRSHELAHNIKQLTNGQGVDVVFDCSAGDSGRLTWHCIAKFGRYIDMSNSINKAGNALTFPRNITYTAPDIIEMLTNGDKALEARYKCLLGDVLAKYRSGQIQLPTITKMDVSDISQGYRYFLSKERVGRVVISLEKSTSKIPLSPSIYLTLLSSEKVYLLVGCLGGLGSSLTAWMIGRGARKFVFIGPSGDDKPTAKSIVSYLQRKGAQVKVVRGDVSNSWHVDQAVQACLQTGSAIGGVIQAAMGLHEQLFESMSVEGWHKSVRPKYAGTWNLHRSLEGKDSELEFFLMTSSVAGSAGIATETNYCAANNFLDAFAHWRRSQGKPAVSIGYGMISEVGYLHNNPDIEAILLRRGLQPMSEEEFLQITDLALSGVGEEAFRGPLVPASSHIVTGLETTRVRELATRGFDVSHIVMDSQRSVILQASKEAADKRRGEAHDKRDLTIPTASIPWLQCIAPEKVQLFSADLTAPSLQDAIKSIIKRRFSNLILIPKNEVDIDKSFADYGMDSMIAAELRTWLWNSFRVEIPFLDFLSPDRSLNTIITSIINSVNNKA